VPHDQALEPFIECNRRQATYPGFGRIPDRDVLITEPVAMHIRLQCAQTSSYIHRVDELAALLPPMIVIGRFSSTGE
jgi:hypothetical protein